MGAIKIKKILKRIGISFLGLILLLMLGLIANNRIYALKYNKLDTNSSTLTSSEISAINGVYEYLNNYGNEIFEGLKENTTLTIFNDSYEFLISDNEVELGWNYISYNEEINRKIHSRNKKNPQAFAVPYDNQWIGSMSTKNQFNKYIVNTVPVVFPPQIMIIDDEHYKATIIHEIVHAHEANNNNARFAQIQKLHNICENYYDNQAFNELIGQEAYYLEQAIHAIEYNDVLKYAEKFLEMRERRRSESNMSMIEVQNEVDFEWLEGLARYAEYKASRQSSSLVAKNLLDIEQKVKIKGDERYYTLGMAQALVLDKLQKDWKKDAFTADFSMEEYIKKICLSN